MATDALHPDHLQPGQYVGSWRILETLGSGGFGRTFKVESQGALFSLKMALRPASEDKEVEGRAAHEAATLMANTSHPNLLRLYALGRWPHPSTGYLYFVTEYVEGENFNGWRARTRPTAAHLVDIFLAVVLAVVELHRRKLLHRDLTGANIVIRKGDHKPFFIDLGSVWLPGSSTLTEKLPPSMAHALPPECVTFLRRSAEAEGEHFDAGIAGDLYQLGVLMFEALTEYHPFDPKKLPAAELLAAIETLVPRPPHYLNPDVPEPLSRIVMRLLEKRPEDRYESAAALHQALWDAAKERKSPTWKVPLVLPESGPAPLTPEEVEDRKARQQESERKAREVRQQEVAALSEKEALEKIYTAAQEFEAQLQTLDEAHARRRKRRWKMAAGGGVVLLSLSLFAAWRMWLSPTAALTAESEKGSLLVSTFNNSRPIKAVAAWLCVTFSVGCPAAQVRPLPEDCPREAVRSMEELHLLNQDSYRVVIDINQPGSNRQEGAYHEGKIVSRVVRYRWTGPLPDGTLLYGQLWTEGLTKEGEEAVLGRYTEALLPDGRRVPVCMVLGDLTGLTIKYPNSKPGQARLPREMSALAIRRWP
ncbi:serine/threonine protein kinase [Stigmatella erecta]|uniref:non-specific serine/threonine protein kinase n=1 Tax=Stigmatella erecta TaxID=83460 RepID=A0A1I0JVP7_9BACT|nr:serine/threonine-protein kinase [Stigmatella erecta]SEU14718.1 serine/threonine protein kinase [Stigmatella erecta]